MRTLALIIFSSALMACGGDDGGDDDADPFDTYQECFTEHHGTEGLSVQNAITTCCLDHPIGSADKNVVCGSSASTCETYVDANLADSDATTTDISDACDAYVTARN